MFLHFILTGLAFRLDMLSTGLVELIDDLVSCYVLNACNATPLYMFPLHVGISHLDFSYLNLHPPNVEWL